MNQRILKFIFIIIFPLVPGGPAFSQPYNIPFTSGPIPLCDTSVFTATVTGIGTLYPPGGPWWNFTLQELTLNITSNHPQTLQIFLTSPQGTTLLLSQFNGAGGQNYTNCTFTYSGSPSITTGSAPFTGYWTAQGGNFSVFDYENANGTWTITVIDTACGSGGGGVGGPWGPGWFNGGGSTGNGGFTIGFSSPPPPPCLGYIVSNYVTICPGQTVDILGFFTSQYSWYNYTIYDPGWNVVANPSAVSAPGQYWIEAYDPWDGCFYTAIYDISVFPQSILGPDQVVDVCTGAGPVNLASLFMIGTMSASWTLNGSPISAATASAATAPGVYQLISTSIQGCNDTALATLNIVPGPSLGPDQTVNTCSGTAVDLTALYATSGWSAAWYFGSNPFASPAAASGPGIYTLVVTDASGCTDTAEVTLNTTSSNFLGGNTLVWACHSGAYDLTQLYATPGLTTTWYFGGNPVANPSAVSVNGIYTLIAQDAFGCTDTADVTLSLQPYPTLGPDQTVSICSGAPAVDLTALFPLSGLTTAWTLNGGSISNATAVAASSSGVYQVIAQTAAGCEDTAQVFLTVLPGPALGPDQAVDVCTGSTFNLLPLYNTAGLSWAWYYGGNPFTTPSSASNAGVYSLIATDAAGCTDTADVTLNLLPAPALGPDQNIAGCVTGTYDLTPLYAPTGTATWYFGGNPVANPAAVSVNGTYTLVDLNLSGCSDTAQVTLNVSQNPSLGPDQNTSTCSNSPADLTNLFTTGGNAASWYFGGSAFGAPSAATTAGVYTLIITTPAGCTDTANATLNVLPAPALGADQTVTGCITGTVDLTALYVTSGLTSAWSLNGNPVANPGSTSSPGSYQLVVTDGNGCTDTAVVILNVSQNPALGPDQNATTCSNTPADLTILFATGGNTASWYFGGSATGAPVAVTTAGVYTLIVATTAGCTDTATATLTVQAAPAVGSDQTQTICSNATLDLTTLFNTAGLTSSWNLAGSPVTNPSGVAVAGTYTLVAVSPSGCSDTASVTLNVDAAPALGADQSASACSGLTADLTSFFNTAGLSTTWTSAGAPVPDPTAVGAAGLYTLVATNSAGCSDTADVSVTVLPLPVPGPDQSLSECDGAVIDLTSLYNTGANAVSWTEGGVSVPDPASITSGGIYTLTVTSPAGCTATATVTVNFNTAPDIGPDQSAAVCAGSSFDLTALYNTSGLIPSWTLGGAPVANAASVSMGGTYQLTVLNGSGCTDTAVVTLTVNPNPSLGPDQSFALCPWQTIDLSAVFPAGGMTATYTSGGLPVANYTAVYDSGTYAVVVTDANGCTDEALALVTNVACLCEADFTFSARCMQEPVKFELQSDSLLLSAHWSFGGATTDQFVPDPEVKFNTTEPALVTLQATLSCGVVTVQKEVRVTDCADSCHFYLPSAFTPNSDGMNDRFTWYGECDPDEFSMEIYNRFGQRVFFTDSPLASWDGNYENTVSPEGVYVYHIRYRMPYQQKQQVSGTMMVVR